MHTHTHVNERLRPTPLSPTKAHSTYIFAYSGESQKKEELDFCSKSFSLIARVVGTHVQTFSSSFVFTRAPLVGLLNRFRRARHIARVVVHRRKERKHALRRRSGPSPEKAKKRDSLHTSRTFKTENESIKRDERERIGHHADRTASVQVCVCFRTSLFSFFSIVPPFTLRRRSAWGRERAHPPRGKNGSSFGKKSDAASPFESEISLSLCHFFSRLRVARA